MLQSGVQMQPIRQRILLVVVKQVYNPQRSGYAANNNTTVEFKTPALRGQRLKLRYGRRERPLSVRNIICHVEHLARFGSVMRRGSKWKTKRHAIGRCYILANEPSARCWFQAN
jgi:hypothetical protein